MLVAVDAGHHPAAPGVTSASGRTELEYNLALREDVRSALEARGFAVRIIGQHVRLADRAREAAGAQLLVSLHHDSGKSNSFAGFSLFISRRNADVGSSARCASAIGAELRASGLRTSRYHADPMPGENRPFADEVNGVHFFDNLAIARTATVPAVLVEAGVIINPEDERRVTSPAMRRGIADAVAAGVSRCLR